MFDYSARLEQAGEPELMNARGASSMSASASIPRRPSPRAAAGLCLLP